MGKLHFPPAGPYYGCRRCHHLTYTSCQEGHKDDAFLHRVARMTGEDFHLLKRVMNLGGKGRR